MYKTRNFRQHFKIDWGSSCAQKNSKQLVDNYRLVSLLSVCSKIFEKLLFYSIYEFLDKICLLNSNQFGFLLNDSSVHQLIAITDDIFHAFDANWCLVVCSAFLDLLKMFDRVWHDGLLYKLKHNGKVGSLLCLLESFLTHRKQQVVLTDNHLLTKKMLRICVP